MDQGEADPSLDQSSIVIYRPHRLAPTCVCISSSGSHVVSVAKDGSIVKCEWDTV